LIKFVKKLNIIQKHYIFANIIQKRNLMKYILKISIIVILVSLFYSCVTEKKMVKPIVVELNNSKDFEIELSPGPSFNHPTFSIWLEDMDGNYLKTLFITKSYASGIFGYKMLGDSIWVNESGESIQPAALPYWTYKKGLINKKNLIPTPENPFIDAYTGATPKGKFTLLDKLLDKKKYNVMLEVNQTWDWNNYWTNNKFPKSNAYKHSSQPSVIYSVTITPKDSVFYLNPIGHGSPTGENGNLHTNLSTLSTALDIFSSIKITIKR